MAWVELQRVSPSSRQSATAAVRLHRVVELGGCEVLGFDGDLGGRQRGRGVAAHVLCRIDEEVLLLERLVDPRDEPEHLELRRECLERRVRGVGAVGGDGGDRAAGEVGSVAQRRVAVVGPVARAEDAAHAGNGPGRVEVERGHLGVGMRAAKHGGLEQPRQGDVDGEARGAGRPRAGRDPGRRVADRVGRAPVVDLRRVVVLDDRPADLGSALDDRLGLDELGRHPASAAAATACSMPS